jgi:protein-S-isoprenylcysteine O-methyltransferase Ste14
MVGALPFVARPPAFGEVARAATVLGIASVLLGQTLRALVIGLKYIGRGGKQGRIHADALVEDGMFAHSRNPLYLGNLLILFGLLLVAGSPGVLLVGSLAGAFVYAAIIAAEEEFLSGKFGARYEEYRARVPRLFPRLRGLGATVRSMRFDWPRLLRKEYGTTFAWVTILIVLLLLSGRDAAGVPGPAALRSLLPIWLVALAGWASIRFLKKSGRLRSAPDVGDARP